MDTFWAGPNHLVGESFPGLPADAVYNRDCWELGKRVADGIERQNDDDCLTSREHGLHPNYMDIVELGFQAEMTALFKIDAFDPLACHNCGAEKHQPYALCGKCHRFNSPRHDRTLREFLQLGETL